ncbi:DUF1996 domain-containing protein [Umezawaea sp. Da 62-37]|uniref:DUF1996 domain-containing protein n=1 Tax=Umezawaea sp. Da 62-37 TaxID=3075927 RepID=UPI0028F6C983|nr:DUF1996 domain-containing protein [Umezawaea sp. Da 62-37]WNV84609.1 DUF1996 domain-containing protein [Umezawaea sp. Da 62-37]
MTRSTARHQISRSTKLIAGMAGLALAIGVAVVVTNAGDENAAKADGADPSLFVDITKVKANVKTPKPQRGATTGTFTVNCGLNENGHFNPDNFIAAPGVQNGAQHLHDYVGNLTTDANSTDQSLDAGGTTCKNGDKSAYFWPVIRIDKGEEEAGGGAGIDCPDVAAQLKNVPQQAKAEVDNNLALLGTQEAEAEKRLADTAAAQKNDAGFVNNAILGPLKEKRAATIERMAIAIGRVAAKPQGLDKLAPCKLAAGAAAADADAGTGTGKDEELEGNDGEVQEPKAADITFRGSPVGQVVAMPKFLKILYGDAKRSINGDKNTKASWTCAGFEDKVLLNKYPICPNGAAVKRIHDFPGCWDGKNTDSANHRDHVAFADATGQCGNGFQAIPQLRITLTYDIPADVQKNAQYKVDSFPAEEHDPFSDHDDFANVMSDKIMNRLVACVNSGKTCKE